MKVQASGRVLGCGGSPDEPSCGGAGKRRAAQRLLSLRAIAQRRGAVSSACMHSRYADNQIQRIEFLLLGVNELQLGNGTSIWVGSHSRSSEWRRNCHIGSATDLYPGF